MSTSRAQGAAQACISLAAVRLCRVLRSPVAMLLGYSDDDGTESDHDLPVAMAVPSAWQPGPRRRSVAEAFSACPPNFVGFDDCGEREQPVDTAAICPEAACAVERMLRLALLVNSPQDYVPVPPRKRRRQKGKPDLGSLLAAVIADPSKDPAPFFDGSTRRYGYHEFERRFSMDLGVPVRSVRTRATDLWKRANIGVQNGWSVLAQVCKIMYTRSGARTRRLCPAPSHAQEPAEDGLRVQAMPSVSCIGVLGTWILDLGLDDPAVLAAVAAGHRGAVLLDFMKGHPLYQQAFNSFKTWVQDKARDSGFHSEAGSMELCLAGSIAHRVHVHAYLGPHVDMMGWQTCTQQVTMDVAGLVWMNAKPVLRFLRPRRRLSQGLAETHGGLYYVLMQKPGTMFRFGNRWPFQDFFCIHEIKALPCC